MAGDAPGYVKTFQDELDWKLLDQLHGVVSQISSFCFETKKFCVTTVFVVLTLTVFVVLTLMVKFTTDKLDHSLFVTGLVIPVCFWFLDAVGYYYQVKLRGMMEGLRKGLGSRHLRQIVAVPGTPIISEERTQRTALRKAVDAAINHSMWLYGFLIGIDLIAWALFASGALR